jgi:hypothetical protein
VFLWAKVLNAKDNHKDMFPVHGGKCLSRKAVHNWVENSLKDVRKVSDDEMGVWNWLRQQSKDFYAAGFDKCINVSGGYVEK